MMNGHYVVVLVPKDKFASLRGLCGVYNQDASDDMTTRQGNLTTNSDEFFNSWDVSCHYYVLLKLQGPRLSFDI